MYVIVLLVFTFALQTQAGNYVVFDTLEICHQPKDSPLQFEYVTIDNSNPRNTFIQVKYEALEDIPSFAATINVERCKSRNLLDSCEHFLTMRPKNTCAFLSAKHEMWSSYFESFDKPIRCPMRKGVYVQTNGTLDANINTIVPLAGFTWRGDVSVYNGRQYLFKGCFQMSMVQELNLISHA